MPVYGVQLPHIHRPPVRLLASMVQGTKRLLNLSPWRVADRLMGGKASSFYSTQRSCRSGILPSNGSAGKTDGENCPGATRQTKLEESVEKAWKLGQEG